MNQSPTLDELYAYVKKFHLSESLYTIGAINAAMKFGFNNFQYTNIPDYIKYWMEKFVDKSVSSIELSLSSTRLARFLLLSESNDFRHNNLILGSESFLKAFNMTGNLHDPDIEKIAVNPSGWDTIFGRMSSWEFPLQTGKETIIGRGYLLFIKIAQSLQLSYDFDKKMKEYFNIGSFEFMASGFVLWLTTNGILDYEMKVAIPELKDIVTRENLMTFVKHSSGTHQDYKRLIRGENWKDSDKTKDIYALDPFVKIPAICVVQSTTLRNNSYIVPQAKYLLDRANTGIFYLLADIEQEITTKKHKNSFRTAFGTVYREYVAIQLRQAKDSLIFIDLDVDFTNQPERGLPDFAIIQRDVCILFELKTSILKIDARIYFDQDKLKEEVKNSSVRKAIVDQLDSFRTRILNNEIVDHRFSGVKKVINILVGYEDIYVINSALLPLLKDNYGNAAQDLQLACISDIDSIGNALNQSFPFVDLILEKVNDTEKQTWMIAIFLEKLCGRNNEVLFKSFIEFTNKMKGQ
jgi:hypothetical protein